MSWPRTLFLSTFLIGFLSQSVAQAELPTVPHVDLARYMGTWFEIARFPNSFQTDCVAVQAEYALQENGQVQVINSCRKVSFDGKLSTAKGKAKVVDKKSGSKLKVSFLPFGLFPGNYWIIMLDPNYEWAVVSEPKQKYLWILSRSPRMEDQTLSDIKAYLASLQFDLTQLAMTPQPEKAY